MMRPLYILALLVFIGAEGFSLFNPKLNHWQRLYRPRRSTSDFSFSYDKRGFFGKMTFDMEIVIPTELRSREITNIEVRFDPSSDMEGKVYITRGGLGNDYATLHFETEKDVGKLNGYVIMETI